MTKRLHLAHFTNTYHPVVSGVVRSITAFRSALTELGHNVFVLAQHAKNHNDEEPFIFRYPALDLPIGVDFPLTIPISPFVDRLLPRLKPDIIHSHHPFLLGQTAAQKAEALDRPLVFTFHTRYRAYSHYIDISQKLVKTAIGHWLAQYLKKCHHVVAPSESLRQILKEQYGLHEGVSVVPTGIDLTPYQQADGAELRQQQGWGDETVLISIGRLAPEKNWATLLRAVATVLADHPATRLVLIGKGESRDDLEQLARDLEITDRVQFIGEVPFEQIPHYLKAADLFCFASTTETQGLVTMEALAAELPVVAVDASGTRDVVTDGQEGLLTQNDSEALAQAILQVITQPDVRHKLQQAAIERVRSLEISHTAQQLVAVYKQAQASHQAGEQLVVEREPELFDSRWNEFLRLGGLI